jgi:hypothetical protein
MQENSSAFMVSSLARPETKKQSCSARPGQVMIEGKAGDLPGGQRRDLTLTCDQVEELCS